MGWQRINLGVPAARHVSRVLVRGLCMLAGAQAVHAAGRQRPSICLQGACAGPV